MNQVVMITGPATTAESGWMKPMFPHSGKAHYFSDLTGFDDGVLEPRFKYWDSLCGLSASSSDRQPMFEAGNWSRCKTCEKLLAKEQAA